MRSEARYAFTLVELIISLTIIGILLAILLPALSSARRASKVVRCAVNLRQIGQAIQEYQTENHVLPYAGLMPAPFDKAPDYKGPLSGPPLYEALAANLPYNSKVYQCPGDTNGEVFDVCAAHSPVHWGMSYTYMGSIDPTAKRPTLMGDFLGFIYPPVTITPFHPSPGNNLLNVKNNVLLRDFSVQTY